MSYPPQQGPYGQQPHGQQGGYPQQPPPGYGGYPHSGPQPQQYPQPGGYDPTRQFGPQQGYCPPPGGYPPGQPPYGQDPYGPYGQQPYGHDPWGRPGGEPPRKKKKTGLIIGSSVAAVVLVGAFLFTAFVAPGFLTGGEDSGNNVAAGKSTEQQPTDTSATAPSTQTGTSTALPLPSTPPGGAGGGSVGGIDRSTPDPVAQAWVVGFNQHSAAAVQPYTCENPIEAGPKKAIEETPGTMEITGTARITGNEAKVPIKLGSQTDDMPLRKQGGQWCVTLDG